MKSLLLKKVFLSLLIVSMLSIGLTSCLDIVVPPTTGTVNIIVSGDYTYDLKMDGDEVFSDKPEGTYTLTNVPIGNHTFEAIDTWGASWGYDSETKYISGGMNNVYLTPPYTP
ncbi:MAG: hypothetical protein JXC36_05810 [Candidatus Atribacteria bacterium]|nr:hypothetical protein [Candidatus Atribacteria bacterium]